MHQWEEKDDLIALLLYKLGGSNELIEACASVVGCTPASLTLRIANMKHLELGSGMQNVAKQSARIHGSFSALMKSPP